MAVGGGKITHYLSKIIEKDKLVAEEACEFLPDSVTVINGNGMDSDLLIEEGISSIDAFVSLTGKDESNILSSVTAIKNDVSKVITKINRDELMPIAENLGIDTIVSKRNIVADEIVTYARALENSIDSQIETLYSLLTDEIEALEFKVFPEFEYTYIPLKDIKFDNNVLIAGISRKNQVIIPTGDDVILPGDRVIVVAEGKRVLGLSDIIAR
jgi:trk system potassium uptake protein TrkA